MSTEPDTPETDEADESSTETDAEDLQVIIEKRRLQQAIDQLRTTVDEAIFRLGRDGLEVRCVDPANVAMTDIHLEEAAFEAVGDGKFPIGVNLERLDDYLAQADKHELVQLTYIPETGMLNIRYGNTEVDLAAIDPDSIRSEPDIPDVDFTASAVLEAGEFVDAVNQCAIATDHVEMHADADDGELSLIGDGDTDDIEVSFGREDLIDGKFGEETMGLYSIEYLTGECGILNAAPSESALHVEYATEFPSKYEYDFAGGHGHATMTLAPRIQN